MRTSRGLWALLGWLSLLCTVVLIAGFAYAMDTVLRPQASNMEQAPSTPAQTESPRSDGPYRIVALGDSLTKGTGDQSGEGYVGHVKKFISERIDEEVYLYNSAVNGYRTDQLLHDLANRAGTMKLVQEADLILFSIGGNDIFSLSGEISEFEINAQTAMSLMPDALHNLEQVIARLTELNSHAKLVYLGLYNPFGDVEQVARETSAFVHQWNYEVQRLLLDYPNAALAPTFDLFQNNVKTYLASDHYHLNEAGYKLAAERIVQTLGWGATGDGDQK